MSYPDSEAVKRIANAEVVAQHLLAVRRFFRRACSGDVDDLTQETFLACLRGKSKFRGESTFRTFLLAVARNQLSVHRRKQKRDRGALVQDPARLANVAASANNSHHYERRELILLHAVRQLSSELRTAIELRYWRKLTQKDIASVLAIPVGTVASRIRRGKHALRVLLSTTTDDLRFLLRAPEDA